MTRLAMVVDLDRCIGCWACAVACKVENSVGEGLWWQEVLTVGGTAIDTSAGSYPHVDKHYEPRNCFHCAEPPCLPVCPTGAVVQRADGIVEIVHDRCIGCTYCVLACPYDAIEMNLDEPKLPAGLEDGHGAAAVAPRHAGVAEKCTFCSHRVDVGLQPACVSACPTDVITFGDIDDVDSAVARQAGASDAYRLREDLGAEPSVWFLPARTAATQRRSGPGSDDR
jgi:molybdopterin-containing oxidoreductase family iron-sulfur binding subunit